MDIYSTYSWTDPTLGDFVINADDPIGREMLRLANHAKRLEREKGELTADNYRLLVAERARLRDALRAELDHDWELTWLGDGDLPGGCFADKERALLNAVFGPEV